MCDIQTVGLIGLGAVGALYAERLLASGAQLRVIVDETRKARYEKEGVLVNGVRVDFPYTTPADAAPVDLLLIATRQAACGRRWRRRRALSARRRSSSR